MAAYRAQMAANAPQVLVWDIGLREVERPAKAKERYGNQVLATQRDTGVTRYSFEDQLVRVLWLPTDTRLHFTLTNKTDYSIKIVWNDAVFVDPQGKSGAVMHEGVKYTDCSSSKTPSVVVRHGSTDDVVLPCGLVNFGYSEWNVASFLRSPSVTAATADSIAAQLRASEVGKTVQVLLPLQIEDVVSDYLFTFEVKGVTTRPRGY